MYVYVGEGERIVVMIWAWRPLDQATPLVLGGGESDNRSSNVLSSSGSFQNSGPLSSTQIIGLINTPTKKNPPIYRNGQVERAAQPLSPALQQLGYRSAKHRHAQEQGRIHQGFQPQSSPNLMGLIEACCI